VARLGHVHSFGDDGISAPFTSSSSSHGDLDRPPVVDEPPGDSGWALGRPRPTSSWRPPHPVNDKRHRRTSSYTWRGKSAPGGLACQ